MLQPDAQVPVQKEPAAGLALLASCWSWLLAF